MRLLVDTQIFLWSDNEPARLSATARALLADPQHERLLSVASVWEIQIKSQLGKLKPPLAGPLRELIQEHLVRNDFDVIPITAEHVFALGALPAIHSDPFDRLIAAVASVEEATVLTADPILRQYPVSVVW